MNLHDDSHTSWKAAQVLFLDLLMQVKITNFVISAGPVSEFRSFMQWNRPPLAATGTQLTTQSSVVRTSPNCAKRLGTAGTLKYFVLELQLTNTILPAKPRRVEFDVGLTGTINYNPSGSPAVRL